MKKISKAALTGGVAAAAIAATVGVAAPANAYVSYGYYAKTTVNWSGSSCIGVNEAYGGYERFCGYGGAWELNEHVYTGQDFGIDPIMGNAAWVSCNVYIDTQLVYSDFAYAGDGTDVNCLRNKL